MTNRFAFHRKFTVPSEWGVRRTGGIPGLLVLPATLAGVALTVPVIAVVLQAPWPDLVDLLTDSTVLAALRLSVLTATVSTVCCVLMGVPLALVLARSHLPGVRLLRAFVTVPMVLPPVVGGVALLLAYGRRGLVGERLDLWFGITIPFSVTAVIMAQVFVSLPFLVLTVEGAVRGLGSGWDEAAATLGGSPWVVFRRVTLPLIRPSLIAGTVLSWARALGEFGATITFAGNVPGRTQTMPTLVYLTLQTEPAAAVALSLVLLVVSVVVLVALRDRWLRLGTPS
ncbi:MAG: ABC transporter permease [Actinomycetota bacterium]